jgi:putative tryptophan/tyrosine transport system substrate-binding protein
MCCVGGTYLNRRSFISGITSVLLAAPHSVSAQQAKRIPRVGLLFPLARPQVSLHVDALEAGFRSLGYTPGQNIILDYRFAEGRLERLPALAAELAALNVDLIASVATAATLAAKSATTTIPIVMIYVGDPVGTGIVQSLARPGGNVTGLGIHGEEFAAKMPEFLKEAYPRTSRVALLSDQISPLYTLYQGVVGNASERLGLRFTTYEARSADAIEAAFQAMVRDRVNAVIVPNQPFTYRYQQRIVELAAKHRLPAIYGVRAAVRAGGLMSYGVDEADVFRRAATYVDKILKGAKPADLPVELPTKFELVVNLKTAKTLGLTIPQLLMLRADEVIQ